MKRACRGAIAIRVWIAHCTSNYMSAEDRCGRGVSAPLRGETPTGVGAGAGAGAGAVTAPDTCTNHTEYGQLAKTAMPVVTPGQWLKDDVMLAEAAVRSYIQRCMGPMPTPKPAFPRIIHHIWLGGALPAKFARLRASFVALMPSWRHVRTLLLALRPCCRLRVVVECDWLGRRSAARCCGQTTALRLLYLSCATGRLSSAHPTLGRRRMCCVTSCCMHLAVCMSTLTCSVLGRSRG